VFTHSADFDPGPGSFLLESEVSWPWIVPDGFVWRLDAGGSLIKAVDFDSSLPSSWSEPTVVALDAAGDVHVVGGISGTVDLDPGPGSVPLTGSQDTFVIKLQPNGRLRWAGHVEGQVAATATGLAAALPFVWVSGYFSDVTDFAPGPAIVNVAPTDGSDTFLLKLEPDAFIGAPGEASLPDVAVEQMRARRLTDGRMELAYTPACDAMDHTVFFGPLEDVATHGYDDAHCAAGVTGVTLVDPPPGDVFFVIVGKNEIGIDDPREGSYGRDSDGVERPEASGVAACDVPQDLPSVTCR
jgi:hypothetical protein